MGGALATTRRLFKQPDWEARQERTIFILEISASSPLCIYTHIQQPRALPVKVIKRLAGRKGGNGSKGSDFPAAQQPWPILYKDKARTAHVFLIESSNIWTRFFTQRLSSATSFVIFGMESLETIDALFIHCGAGRLKREPLLHLSGQPERMDNNAAEETK